MDGCLVDRDIPDNDGFFRFIDINAPPGLVVNCAGAGRRRRWLGDLAAPCATCCSVRSSQALPEAVPAGCKAMVCHAVFSGRDPGSRARTTSSSRPWPAATAAAARSDGPDAVQTHHQNSQNTPIEEMEVFYPVRTVRHTN